MTKARHIIAKHNMRLDTSVLKYTNTLWLFGGGGKCQQPVTLAAHCPCPPFPQTPLLCGKVRTLHVDIKGHLEDLLELRSVKDWLSPRMAAL